MEPTPATRPRRRKRARQGRKRTLALLALAVAVVAVGIVAWVGVRAMLAKGELEGAIPLASTLQEQIVSGDGDAARLTGQQLSARASSAAALTSDPLWRAFEGIPSLGRNLSVVRQLAAAVDDLSQDAIVPLTEAAGLVTMDDFRPVDGVIDVQPIADAQPAVSTALTAMRSALRTITAIDTDGTLDEVSAGAGRLKAVVEKAVPMLDAIDRAVRIVPAMLGAEGPRDYLLLVQNPAELRSSGGIVGAVALIHTENGSIQLVQQASGASFSKYTKSVLDLPADTINLYGAIAGQYMLNAGLTPNFPVSAAVAQEMWRLQYGANVDGVLSIDPIALSYILAATGPVALPTGDALTSDNAVDLLLADVYKRYEDPKDQDAFFASAAASVFSAVAGGNVDPLGLLTALTKAGAERRILVWSADQGEQDVLSTTTLSGTLPLSDARTQRFGLYLNDSTGAKMDTYLDVSAALGQATCRNDGRPNYSVEVTLRNSAPGDAGSTLPRYVTGGGAFGVAPGNIKTIVSVYAAPGFQNNGVISAGMALPYFPATDEGYEVSAVTVELAPGESTVLTYNWLGADAFHGRLELQMTPVIHRNETKKLDMGC